MPAPASPHWFLKIPPPVWLLVLLLAAWASDAAFGTRPIAQLHAPLSALVFGLVGLVSALSGRLAFARAGTEIVPTSATNTKLVTHGPFRFTRNPMYLGLVLIALGIAFYRGTLPFFAVPLLLFLLCNFAFIPFEEAKMQRQFGDAFAAYRARVRRWL